VNEERAMGVKRWSVGNLVNVELDLESYPKRERGPWNGVGTRILTTRSPFKVLLSKHGNLNLVSMTEYNWDICNREFFRAEKAIEGSFDSQGGSNHIPSFQLGKPYEVTAAKNGCSRRPRVPLEPVHHTTRD
jgi:hypothetical protein